jgi:dTDP-4-dehydrorhamnose 3,5-epimerase
VRFIETDLPGAYVLELEQRLDERGFFARVWCRDEFAALKLTTELAQCSISRAQRLGRCGMHFQRARTRKRSSCVAPAARSTT